MSPPAANGATRLRRALLLATALAALAAVLGGLARFGWLPELGAGWVGRHGPLFAPVFFGTVIALERAVAFGGGWAMAAPGAGALAALLLVAGFPQAAVLALLSSVGLAVLNLLLFLRERAAFTGVMLVGAFALVATNAFWVADRPVFLLAPGWMAFFVLTIAAERLELSRLARIPRPAAAALAAVSVATALLACAYPVATGVVRPLGVGFVVIAAWQLRYDLARRTLRLTGMPRFAAAGILSGSVWLGIAGVLMARYGLPAAGPLYDAPLHAVFVGYVLSMVFAHAPIILPAVARIAVGFHPVLWVPLAALHLSLVARVAGNVHAIEGLPRWGGLGNALSLVLFALAMGVAHRAARRR